MKISINPMAQLVKRAERRINFHKTVTAQDLAHDRKRQLAQAVADGATPTAEFANAAALEGVSPAALAATILAKPDVMMARENERRALILKVRGAASPAELDAVMANIPNHPEDRLPELI